MATSREEFVVAAVERGDVQIAERYFAQEDIIFDVKRTNSFFLRLETPFTSLDKGPADPWYFTQPPGQYLQDVGSRSLVFYTAMEKNSIALLQWLFAPAQAAFMGVTLAALLPFVGELAADLNHAEALELLLASYVFTRLLDESQRQTLLTDMLCTAVERSHKEAIMVLVAHGALVNAPATTRPRRDDVLSLSASMGTAHCVEILATEGITIVGADVLYHASTTLNVEATRMLLQLGVDWGNATGTTTPLHVAAQECHPELMRLLLEYGFMDVDVLDSDGATAIELASTKVDECECEDNESQNPNDLVLLLRRYGANSY